MVPTGAWFLSRVAGRFEGDAGVGNGENGVTWVWGGGFLVFPFPPPKIKG